MTDLFQRLGERKLVQWAVGYAAGAFAVIEGMDIVAQRFAWPDTAQRVLIVLLAVGFLATLVLAWFHGERGAQRVGGAEWLILSALVALGGVLVWRTTRPDAVPAAADQAAVAATTPTPPAAAPADRRSIAVLPFESLSEEKANAYFASGMQDMILTRLSAIGGLKVISRTSTQKYASRPDDLETVAAQLGAATLLEGSVQKSGNSVLINVQLIDAATDQHLWAEAYTRTLDDVFEVEGEVAQKVAEALKATLTPAESASVAVPPTRNAGAYDYFLKAEFQLQQARDTWREETFDAADAAYRQAIALDPGFALAHANLAYCRMRRHWFATQLTPAELAEVKASAERAVALAPNLPEAHLALAYYHYWGFRRYDEAVAELERAAALAPSNVDAIAGLAFIARRKGEWQRSIDEMDRALQLSPRDGRMRAEQGASYVYLRRWADAQAQLEQALALNPDDANAKDFLLVNRLFGYGDAAGARAAYAAMPAWRTAALTATAGDVMNLVDLRAYPDLFERRFDAALKAWDDAPTDTVEQRRTGRVARVAIELLAGRASRVQAECGELIGPLEDEAARQPESLQLLQQLSWVDLCLGRKAQAIAAAQRAVAILPIEKDAYNGGANLLAGLAQVQAQAGATDQALATIAKLLALPTGGVMSIERLERDPVWDPIRADPRFAALAKQPGAG